VINYRKAAFRQGYRDDNPYSDSENAATAAYMARGGKRLSYMDQDTGWEGNVQSRRMHELGKRSGGKPFNGLD
jgi:hypothetical protein